MLCLVTTTKCVLFCFVFFPNYSPADLIYFLLTPILDVMDQAGAARLPAPEWSRGDVSLWAPPLMEEVAWPGSSPSPGP